jgi:Carboxypeptidase regulatory-like domain
MKAKLILLVLFFIGKNLIVAQSQATLRGTLTDKSGETLIGASVMLFKDGVRKAATSTDIDGNYSINTDSGTYDVEFIYIGLKTLRIRKVILYAGQMVCLNEKLEENPNVITSYCFCYYLPIIQQDKITSGFTLKEDKINRLPTRDISTMVNMNFNL